jgi:hypothetical protein
MTTPEVTKSIRYNKDTKDFDVYCAIDGDEPQYIGSVGSYGAGEVLANQYAIDFYIDAHTPEKAVELDMTSSMSRHVAAKTYPAFGRFVAQAEALALPAVVLDLGAQLADELTAALT